MMYSAYKLNKQGDNIQPWRTPFPIWNQSVVPCPILTVASWPAYRFLKRQVRWSGMPISFRVFQFIVIHTVKGFGIVNKAEIDVFLELSCFINLLLEKCKSKLQWDSSSHQSEWPSSKNLQTINAGEGVEKREPSYIVSGNVNWYIMENGMDVS